MNSTISAARDHVAVGQIPLVLDPVACARGVEVVDPVEPDQWIGERPSSVAGLEGERIVEQPDIRTAPEDGVGDELVHERLREGRRVVAIAEQPDRLVGALRGHLRIEADVFEQRHEDRHPEVDVVASLDERSLLVGDPLRERIGVRGERSEE